MSIKSVLAAGCIGLAMLGAPAALAAQDTSSLTAETVTDEQIGAFVRAAIALEELRKDYTVRIASAETDEQRAALTEEADTVAKQLVEKVQGITPDEYLVLSRLAFENPDVNARVSDEIQRMREQKAEFERKKAQEQLSIQSQSPEFSTE